MSCKFASAAASLLFLAANARAELIFGTGPIQVAGPPPAAIPIVTAPSVNVINGNASLGAQFFNNTTTNFIPTGPSTFNVIGSNLLSTYGFTGGRGTAATYSGLPVVIVFAAQGVAPRPVQFQFNQATVALFTIPAIGNYNQFDPSTWGTANAPIATFTLRAGENSKDVTPGPGIFNLTAGQWNQTTISFLVGAASQSSFLFNEAVNPNFWNDATNVDGSGLQIRPGEGVGIRVDQFLAAANTANTQFIDSAAEMAALNAIFNALLPGTSPFGFATGFGGPGNAGGVATDFNPSSSASGAPNTADSIFSLGTTTGHFLTQQTQVPEPATLAVFAGAMGVGGLASRKRRTRVA